MALTHAERFKSTRRWLLDAASAGDAESRAQRVRLVVSVGQV